jgi:hypothetical protein
VRFLCNTAKALQGHPRCTCGDYIHPDLFIEGVCGHRKAAKRAGAAPAIEKMTPQTRRIPALKEETATSSGPGDITFRSRQLFKPPQIVGSVSPADLGENIRKPSGIHASV